MTNRKNKLFGIILGTLTILFAFVTVFGNPIPKLVVDGESSKTVISEKVDVPSATTTTPAVTTPKPTTPTPKPVTKPTPSPARPSTYSLVQISSHDSATTCWSAINGGVYDLTNWVDRHPGGRMAILMICGKDGSPLFNAQHGNSGRISSILQTYKIGALKS